MHRTIAAAALAASLTAMPLAAQGLPPAPDPAGDAVPGGALPPPSDSLPSGDPVPSLPAETPPPFEPGAAPAPQSPVPATPGVPAETAFTEADVTNFARAVIALDPIQADATLDETERQTRMGEALASVGIEVETFNAMAVQSQTDAELKTRIQTQIAALQAAQPPSG